MSTSTTRFRGGLTRMQVATAACAVAAAAAFPAVVAKAEPIAPRPIAPVTQILIDAPLSPIMTIAEQPNVPWWLQDGRRVIERFGALVFAVAGAIIAPIAAVTQAIVTAVQRFFQIGPYSTGRG